MLSVLVSDTYTRQLQRIAGYLMRTNDATVVYSRPVLSFSRTWRGLYSRDVYGDGLASIIIWSIGWLRVYRFAERNPQ